METLFSDSEVFTKERPTKASEAQLLEIYKIFAAEMIKNRWSRSPIDVIVEDFKKLNPNQNGYELAKILESDGRGHYNVDSIVVEHLDFFSHSISEIVRKNVKTWVEAHKIKASLEKGSKLIVCDTFSFQFKKDYIYYITGIREDEANYLIHEDKEHNGGYVVPFEIVEKNCKIVK